MAAPAARAETDKCMECHGEASSKRSDGTSVFVDAKAFAASVHGEEAECTDCHADLADVEEFPHTAQLARPACGECHDGAVETWTQSAHGAAKHSNGDGAKSLAAQCWDCHGSHDILPSKHVDSRTSHFKLAATCGRCHGDTEKMVAAGVPSAAVYGAYRDSIHAKGLQQAGLTVAPNCGDCHGAHDIVSAKDPSSRLYRTKVAVACSKCHSGLTRQYEESVHGKAVAAGNAKAPTCVACHSAHGISETKTDDWRLKVLGQCGTCHKESLQTYQNTFHGQVTDLGYAVVATCADCHGSHGIQPQSDPRSMVSAERRTQTCAACHEGADDSFASFDPHADPHDAERDPLLFYVAFFMGWLLIIVFSIFGLHTLAWAVRTVFSGKSHPKAAETASKDGGGYVLRFKFAQRILHFCLMSSFLGLAATGLPLLFAQQKWAWYLSRAMGGYAGARLFHRFFAIVMISAFVYHVADLCYRVLIKRERGILWGPTSMVPQPSDAREMLQQVLWFFGLAERPKFDHFTYWEKFDYWAVFWGMAIIGGSGLVLWFPVFFTSFLPGWIINIAMIIHGEEALLAVGFIFSIHFFNSHLRPEKFPMDMVIFTGRVSMHELAEERPAELARLQEAEALDAEKSDAPERTAHLLGRVIGTAAVATGLVLLAFILAAVLT